MINLGRVVDNNFKESDAVSIAKRTIEKNRSIKTYFSEMDKRPNLDGQMAVLMDGFEGILVDVQIKTLPEEYRYHESKKEYYEYYYDCDTKVFNVVKERVTQNPVVLILVDIKAELVYSILITHDYVHSLDIGTKSTKRIKFKDDAVFDESKFLSDLLSYIKIIKSDVALVVNIEAINETLNSKNKPYYNSMDELKNSDGYRLVYQRGAIKGYLIDFYFTYSDKDPVKFLLLEVISMSSSSKIKREVIQIHDKDEVIQVNRSIQRTNATDADICNILYEISYALKKKLLYYSAGTPTYLIEEDRDVWGLHSQKIEKDW